MGMRGRPRRARLDQPPSPRYGSMFRIHASVAGRRVFRPPDGLLFYAPPGWPPVPPVLLSISFLSSSFLLFLIRLLYYVSSSNLFALRASARASCSMPLPDGLLSLLFSCPLSPRIFLRALRRCVSNRSAAQACFTTYFRKIFCWKIWRIRAEYLTLHSLLGNGGSRHRKAAFGAAATDVARPAQK